MTYSTILEGIVYDYDPSSGQTPEEWLEAQLVAPQQATGHIKIEGDGEFPPPPVKSVTVTFEDVEPTPEEREEIAAEFERIAAAAQTLEVFATAHAPARTYTFESTPETVKLRQTCKRLAKAYRSPLRRAVTPALRLARPRAAARTRSTNRRRPSGTRGSPVADASGESPWEALEESLLERAFGVPDSDFVFWAFLDAVAILAADARLGRAS